VDYCPVTPAANQFTVQANGDVKPLNPDQNNPYVVRGARFEQIGDCVTLGAAAWGTTYLGDFLAADLVTPFNLDQATWRDDKYIVLNDPDNEIIFHGFDGLGIESWTGGDVQICVVAGPLLRVSFDGKQFDLQVPFPYYLDLAVSFPLADYVFPFSQITETHVASNLPILVDKATQDCQTHKATVGTLRNVGECIYVDLSFLRNDGFFVIGKWISNDPPLPLTIRTCENYENGQAIILDADANTVDVCGATEITPESVCKSGDSTFNDFKNITICKTPCGISTRVVSAECDLRTIYTLPGDFQLSITGAQVTTASGSFDFDRSICAFYRPELATVNAFTATCPPIPDN